MKTVLQGVLLLMTGLVSTAQANNTDTESKLYQWYGERSLGFNRSTGNSSTQNLLGKLRLQRDGRQWDSDIKLEAIVSSADGEKNRQTTTVEAQAGYRFSDHSYSFANVRYMDDRFGAFASQASVSTGIGWKPFQGERRQFALEGGVGVRHSEQQLTEQRDSELVMRGKIDWQYQLTDTTQVIKNLHVESGRENTQVESEAALRLKITADLGLKLSYRLRSSSQAPEGISGTDTLTAVSLDMAF
ncbi:DUF481 domain-containing protein [Porticoccus sp. W117]|uniref:DUF481 domain-containing protein n=1 Tax=Porticoccus sp. W117 TaxID=3054777 RepID=UPI0025989ABA|nr:DUF481 domain-containing protein [Porticoccus sp. W117]MDM3870134.1 DUF481 domain-containing protein [Porticoccus sp. W117]